MEYTATMSLEFQFLVGPELAAAEAQLPVEQRVVWPADTMVAYAIDSGRIIGRMGCMSVKILEGTWVAPDAPPTTAYRLMKQMEAVLSYLGNTHALAMVYDEHPQIADYLKRVDFERVPVQFYSKELVKKEEAA